MSFNARGRRALLRLVWSVPLAFAVVSAFAATGVINCVTQPNIPCYQNCAALTGGGGGPPPPPTPYYHGDDDWTHGGGHYANPVTVYGYYVTNGEAVPFPTVYATTQGVEICEGTPPQTDWNNSAYSPDGTTPWTLQGSGGYADGPGDCWGGHAITAVVGWDIEEHAGGMDVSENKGHYNCYSILPHIQDGSSECPG